MTIFYRIVGYNSKNIDIREIVSISILSGESINKYIQDNNIEVTKTPKLLLFETLNFNFRNLIGKSTVSVSDEELFSFLEALKESFETEMGQLEQFEYLKEIFETSKMKKILANIEEQVTLNGMPLYAALKENNFPAYVVSSVEVGSEAGNINLVLTKLLELVKTKIDTSRAIKKMLREPKIVGGFLVGYFFFTMFYFIPKSKTLLKFSDPEKWPELTKTLINWSDFANDNPMLFSVYTIISLGFILFGIIVLIKLLAKIFPPIKKINKMQEISLIFSVLTVAAYSNVLIQDALKQASGIVNSPKTKKDLEDIALSIEAGERFSEQLKNKGFERKLVLDVTAGEATSNYTRAFEKIAKKYKQRVDDAIEVAMAFIKPLTLVFAAGTLITIYYGVNAPLLNFGSIAGG